MKQELAISISVNMKKLWSNILEERLNYRSVLVIENITKSLFQEDAINEQSKYAAMYHRGMSVSKNF